MTKFKVCAKIHLFIIISSVLIAIGLAVGTICHFCANGFFNYGGEFTDYTSVSLRYYMPCTESDAKSACDNALGGFNAYEFTCAQTGEGGEIVYKFASDTDKKALSEAVDKINDELNAGVEEGLRLNVAAVHEGSVKEGGSKAITFASIALASAAAFQFIYFVIRYKLRAAFSALLACVHNLGVFVALAAITRIPVGTDMIAFGAAVVLLTMITSALIFDRTRKNFANEKYSKTDRLEVTDTSACEVRMLTFIPLCVLAAATVVLGVFAAIAQMWAAALAPYALVLIGLISVGYGAMFFTPAVHGAIDGVCENVKQSLKARRKSKPAKSEKTADISKSN
ncbi:MAG: hypothetical protein NC131_08450 [Roseburia sp.]|nr:hypothetical protein [Roseburia sp.]